MDKKEELVRQFYESWQHMDIEKIRPFLTDDFYFQNGPQDPIMGLENFLNEVRRWWSYYPTKPGFEINVDAAGIDGDRVYVVRSDYMSSRFEARSGPHPAMGSVEVRGDKICRWRDYLDRGSWLRDMGEKRKSIKDTLPIGSADSH